MAKAMNAIKTETNMKVTSKMVRLMATECLNGVLVRPMMGKVIYDHGFI